MTTFGLILIALVVANLALGLLIAARDDRERVPERKPFTNPWRHS